MRGRRSLAPVVVALLAAFPAASAHAADASFTRAPDIELGPFARMTGVTVGDFNSDGTDDLVIADTGRSQVHTLVGKGDGTFRWTDTESGLESANEAAVADLNGDGHEDLIVATRLNQSVAVYRGLGTGMFQPEGTYQMPAGQHSNAVKVGDFNGDGRDDIAVASKRHVSVLLGNGDLTFALNSRVDIEVGNEPLDLVPADFDGNGTEDLIVRFSALHNRRLGLLRGKGTGLFEPIVALDVARYTGGVAAGDLNGDGRRDLAASLYSDGRLNVLLGAEGGSFAAGPDVPAGSDPASIAVADFDLDGNEDLAVTNYSAPGTVSTRLGRGDGGFDDGGAVAVNAFPSRVAAGDFNGDGCPDLVVTSAEENTVNVLLGRANPRPRNLLVNGDFETSAGGRLVTESPAIPGWTRSGAMTFLRYGIGPHLHFPTHVDAPRFGGGGNHFAFGGWGVTPAGGTSLARQTVDVSDTSAAIDSGRATANLSAYLGGSWIFGDHMTATAEFFGSSEDVRLGSFSIGPVTHADRKGTTALLRRAASAPVPAGTQRIRVTLTARAATDQSGALADNVELTLDVRPPGEQPPTQQPPAQQPPAPVDSGDAPPVRGPAPDVPGPPARNERFGTRTNVTLRLATGRVVARGPVPVTVTNANPFEVSGTLSAATGRGRTAVKLRGSRFTLQARARTTLRLALPRPLRRQLQRKGTLALRLTAVISDPAGGRRTVRKRVSPRLERRRGRRARVKPRATQLAANGAATPAS